MKTCHTITTGVPSFVPRRTFFQICMAPALILGFMCASTEGAHSVTKPFKFTVDGDATGQTNSSYAWYITLKASEAHQRSWSGVLSATTLPWVHSVPTKSYHGGSGSTSATIQAPTLVQQGPIKHTDFQGQLDFQIDAAQPYWSHGEVKGTGNVNGFLTLAGNAVQGAAGEVDLKLLTGAFGDDVSFNVGLYEEMKAESVESYYVSNTQCFESSFTLEAGLDASASAGEGGLILSASATGYARYTWNVIDPVDPARSFSAGAYIDGEAFSATGVLAGLPWDVQVHPDGSVTATLDPSYSPSPS